jgi:hypothetical protein
LEVTFLPTSILVEAAAGWGIEERVLIESKTQNAGLPRPAFSFTGMKRGRLTGFPGDRTVMRSQEWT